MRAIAECLAKEGASVVEITRRIKQQTLGAKKMAEINTLSVATNPEIAEIMQVLDECIQGWLTSDAERLKALWNVNHEQSTYQPMEIPEILQGWKAIANYYEQTVNIFRPIAASLQDPLIDLGDNYAHVSSKSKFVVQNEDGTQTTFTPRLSFTLEHRENRWQIVHYAEAATVS